MARPPSYSPDQLARMVELRDSGMPTADIARQVGIPESTVRGALKKVPPATIRDNPALPARARATKGKPATTPAETQESATIRDNPQEPRQVAVEVIPAVSRAQTLDELANLLKMAKRGYERAAAQDDESKRTWMETSYMKIMKDCIVQMGRWCGLDGTITDSGPKGRYTRKDIDRMDRDTMRRLIVEWKRP